MPEGRLDDTTEDLPHELCPIPLSLAGCWHGRAQRHPIVVRNQWISGCWSRGQGPQVLSGYDLMCRTGYDLTWRSRQG